jgi:hypothetical protein
MEGSFVWSWKKGGGVAILLLILEDSLNCQHPIVEEVLVEK